MKNILMIGTGGTIASGQTADGLAPELDPSRLLQDTPLCYLIEFINLSIITYNYLS